jgi:uncharacterized protein (DUF1800 family)
MSIARAATAQGQPDAGEAQRPVRPGFRVTRRQVLGGALAGGAAVAGVRLLGLDRAAVRMLAGSQTDGRADWVSPLGAEKAQVAHLLRRTTFGASAEELEQAQSDGFQRTVDRLLETKPSPPPPFTAVGPPLKLAELQLWWVSHMLTSPTPFAEWLTLFWHNHFTSDYQKVGLRQPFLYWQNLTWREMGLGDLRSMLMRVTVDPAMLRYLDLGTSTGANPNENYSRELMELFTMGLGYTENDVRAGAKALAGWVLPKADGRVPVTLDKKNGVTRMYPVYRSRRVGTFVRRRAYDYSANGPVTFLGKTGEFDTQGVIDHILAQPATAAFIAQKFVEHLVTGRVDGSYVKNLADKFRSSGYDVKTLLREIFTSSEFLADRSYRALVKSPTEFMVSVLKALRAPQLARLAVASGHNMGQMLFNPPDVGGWPNNDAWISSNTVIARVNFVTTALGQLHSLPPSDQVVAHLDGVVSPQTAHLLDQAVDEHARWFLALASPEFQLK